MAEEEVIVTSKFQLKRGLAENWTDQNPILLEGEPGAELDTGKLKIGDGTTHWNDLPYTSNLPDVNVMHFKGLIDTDPTLITTGYNPGDVVLYSTREYIWATSENEPTTYKFRELGNEEDVLESPDSSYNLWELPQGFHRFTHSGWINFYYNTGESNYFRVVGPTTGTIYMYNDVTTTYCTYSIISNSHTYQGWIKLQILDGHVNVQEHLDLSQVSRADIVIAITDDNKQRVDLIPSLTALTNYCIPTITLSQDTALDSDTIPNGWAKIEGHGYGILVTDKNYPRRIGTIKLEQGLLYKSYSWYVFLGKFTEQQTESQGQIFYSYIYGHCDNEQPHFQHTMARDVETNTNKSTTIDSSSTDATYPSSKAVYDAIQAALLVDEDAEVN